MLSKRYGPSENNSGDSIAALSTSTNAERPVRLLVVDDHLDTLHCMAKLLSSVGYTVRSAVDAESALEAVSKETYDVVISDLRLAHMDGYDLMRKVRQQCASVGIAISGYGMPIDIQKSRDAGFMEHLVKPVDFESVLSAVTRAVASQGAQAGLSAGSNAED